MNLYTDDDITRLSGSPGTHIIDSAGRTAYAKDYGRLLHAPSFRRLQGKTQLFPGYESDFFRNRLTHSLEVAQIASGVAARLNEENRSSRSGMPDIDRHLVELSALSHDLGHPPFGHNGERALDLEMRRHGGFEGNAQTLRILSKLERRLVDLDGRMSSAYGLDLTVRSLASVLKYDTPIPSEREPDDSLAKGYYKSESQLVDNIKLRVAAGIEFGGDSASKFKTIECSIMDLSDDIAYSTYDLDDSLRAKLVSPFGLWQGIFNNGTLRERVLRKTNAALTDAGYEPVDDREIIAAAAKLFPKDSINSSQPDHEEESASDEERFLFDMVEAYSHDQRLVSDPLARTRYTGERIGRLINSVELDPRRTERFPDAPQLWGVRLSRAGTLDVEILKHLIFELVTKSPRLAVSEYRGKKIVADLFSALIQDEGSRLPVTWCAAFKRADDESEQARVVCDYISGMTDRFAGQVHASLYGQGNSIFLLD